MRRSEDPDFVQRQLRQVPEINAIEVRTSQWSGTEALVSGQLLRAGHFAGQPVDESVPFTLRLTCSPNRDLAHGSRYPVIIIAFTLTYGSSRS